MKTSILFFILLVALPVTIAAQQTDENTLAINNYFQVNNEKPISNPLKLDTNIQSYVNVEQTGIENNTYINSLQTGDKQVVTQTGDQNNYEYYNYYSREDSNLNVNQEGNQNSLQIFGENSLMKNAVINQKSSFKSLVIKNYTN